MQMIDGPGKGSSLSFPPGGAHYSIKCLLHILYQVRPYLNAILQDVPQIRKASVGYFSSTTKRFTRLPRIPIGSATASAVKATRASVQV